MVVRGSTSLRMERLHRFVCLHGKLHVGALGDFVLFGESSTRMESRNGVSRIIAHSAL